MKRLKIGIGSIVVCLLGFLVFVPGKQPVHAQYACSYSCDPVCDGISETGDCAIGLTCCNDTGCSGTCETSCGLGMVGSGECKSGLECCVEATPTPTGSVKPCAHNSLCGADGCTSDQAWVTNYSCPAGLDCSLASDSTCVSLGGSCVPVDPSLCGQCHSTGCSSVGYKNDCCGISLGCLGETDDCHVGTYFCGVCNPSPSGSSNPNPSDTNTPTSVPPTLTPTPTPIPGIIQARAVRVDSTVVSCDDIVASNNYVSDTFSLSPDVPPGAQTVSGGNYATWTAAPGSYDISDNGVAGYALKNYCSESSDNPGVYNSGSNATLNPGATLTWTLGYAPLGPWVQAGGGGDVYAAGAIQSYPPPGATPQLFCTDGAGGTPGIITYGSSFDFDPVPTSQGNLLSSTRQWLVNETYAQTDFYQEFYNRFGSPTATDNALFPDLNAVSMPSTRATPYYITGDMTTSGNWSVADGESIVFLVDGNLTIGGKININGANHTGFIAFIVSGNITVLPTVGGLAASSVPAVEGIYITDKTFSTGDSSNANTERFVGHGTFVANNFSLNRDLTSVGANNNASELFLYDPQLLITMPDEMRDVPITWQEVAP